MRIFFIIYLTAPRLTLCNCQLLPPESDEEEHENYMHGFSVKSLFWATWTILGQKMTHSHNSYSALRTFSKCIELYVAGRLKWWIFSGMTEWLDGSWFFYVHAISLFLISFYRSVESFYFSFFEFHHISVFFSKGWFPNIERI